MTSSNKKQPETAALRKSGSEMPTDLLLSLATGPMLLGILAAQAVGSWLQSVGLASEEVFRGDRLPVLHVPDLEREQ